MRTKIKLKSTASAYFYTTTKKKKTQGDKATKLSLNKYDPVVGKHVRFEEEKL
jgi:large subunit ribosomal protein L33